MDNQPDADWAAACDALRREVDRVTSLLQEVHRPTAPAVGHWNLAEVAMHLSQVWIALPALARGTGVHIFEDPAEGADDLGSSFISDLWDLAGTTMLGVASDPERDPVVLAERIETRAADYLADCTARSPTEMRPWIVEGISVTPLTITCHLLNETVAHGYDMARADGRRWTIDPAHAAMVLDGFLIPVFRAMGSRTMVDQDQAAGVRACLDIRIRGGGRYFFVFDEGTLAIEEPSSRPVDCHLSVDPAAFLLVAWDRISQWQAIATGKFMAWGRKPWRGLKLRGLMRNP